MGEFIFNRGRSKTAHSYPDTRAGANSPPGGAFARNYATGPSTSTPISDGLGTQVPWVAAVPGTNPEDVPITPRVTGYVLITGLLTINNTDVSKNEVQVLVEIEGIPLPVPQNERNTIDTNVTGESGGAEAIPFETTPLLPIGVTSNVQIRVISSDAGKNNLLQFSSTISVQEVSAPTG